MTAAQSAQNSEVSSAPGPMGIVNPFEATRLMFDALWPFDALTRARAAVAPPRAPVPLLRRPITAACCRAFSVRMAMTSSRHASGEGDVSSDICEQSEERAPQVGVRRAARGSRARVISGDAGERSVKSAPAPERAQGRGRERRGRPTSPLSLALLLVSVAHD